MKNYPATSIIGCTSGLALVMPGVWARDHVKNVKVPVIAARPGDASSPKVLVNASFEVEPGPVGAPRNGRANQHYTIKLLLLS